MLPRFEARLAQSVEHQTLKFLAPFCSYLRSTHREESKTGLRIEIRHVPGPMPDGMAWPSARPYGDPRRPFPRFARHVSIHMIDVNGERVDFTGFPGEPRMSPAPLDAGRGSVINLHPSTWDLGSRLFYRMQQLLTSLVTSLVTSPLTPAACLRNRSAPIEPYR